MNILKRFSLAEEKEDLQTVTDNIKQNINFRGTNLWILIFAIFIASLGLNINSTAVIIGAMLVSPLMGPIIGLGFGIAVNDLPLVRKALFSYLFAAAVGLTTSTIYFFVSPLNEAHSEILARTSPNIYDVLIAIFGGLAGILATSSRLKGNVIPGVAIATALMPPLCTAGYGLATFQLEFFFGALYLFVINTVFIALATLVTARLLKFPFKHLPENITEIKAKRIAWVIAIVTVLPSLYFGVDLVRQNKFNKNANRFIEYEAVFPNDYLLQKVIDTKSRSITLTYGGSPITTEQIENLKLKLDNYNLAGANVEIRQGFSYLQDNQDQNKNSLSVELMKKELELLSFQNKFDSISLHKSLSNSIFRELKAQYREIESVSIQQTDNISDSLENIIWLSYIYSATPLEQKDRRKIEDWLKVRVKAEKLKINFEHKNDMRK
jgi:uncharacterized hydrophobic protein (TIGR00271 family)